MDKHTVLKQYFGYDTFRSGQEDVVDALLAGRDTLGVMPTGAGKSLCFQVPGLLLGGVTIVVSPLISLMNDQVNALKESGIRAAFVNSTLTGSAYFEVLDNAMHGRYKLLYVAPERLLTEDFLRFATSVNISMLVVDEAHCISQWGQDFRPSYLDIPQFINRLRVRPIVSAFTATATKAVRDDIHKLLQLVSPYVLVTGFDRKNLYFGVVQPKDRNSELAKLVREYSLNHNRSGIVYCSTRKNVEQVCERLNVLGVAASRYHAGLSDAERAQNQDDFTFDRKRVMVATNAFGMGIDKSNVSYVIHYNMPKDIESYYQEAGRAGRDGSDADCILLYNGQDVVLNRFLIQKSRDESALAENEADAVMRKDMKRLQAMIGYSTDSECLRHYILRYFGEKADNECGNCSHCNGGSVRRDITIEAQKILSCISRCGQRFGRTMIIDVLRGSKGEKVKKHGFEKLTTYGIMSDTSSEMLNLLIDRLITKAYISVSDDGYDTLSLTIEANSVLRGQEKVEASLPEPKKKQPKTLSIFKNASTTDADKRLFMRLKALRMQIASEGGVPAYFIFSDATLEDMCRRKPLDEVAMRRVQGVGDLKFERYGQRFIDEVGQFMRENYTKKRTDK